MVALKSIFLAAVLATSTAAQSLYPNGWKAITVDQWGGLNLLLDSAQIGMDAQQAANVLTDSGYLEKRPGNVRLATILAGSTVKYANDWASPSGTRYLIAQASSTIYQTDFSTNPIALSSVAAGYNITTVPAFSKLEFADGFRSLWYWNGNSTATVVDANNNPAPVCTYIAFKDSRIWCANLPNGFSVTGNTTNGGGSSTVIISSAGGDGYWAVPADVGLVDNVPNRFDFNPDDGDHITCLATTPWGMFVGKRNSSYIVKGSGNLSYDPRILDPKIGCVDNRSVQMVYGVLKWLGVDGVYGYDGSGPPRLLTRELDPLMALVRETTFSQGQWATQLQSDWSSGTTSTTTGNVPVRPWDYVTIAGEIYPSSGTLYDDNTNPVTQTCTTQTNPDTGLPWKCGGVGFGGDTLVNIDTSTYPLSIGSAQIIPSSGGVQVWLSSFPAGNYTTLYTTWTITSGSLQAASSFAGVSGGGVGGGSNGNNIFYTMANSSGATPSSNGWNYGFWSMHWLTNDNPGPLIFGQCSPSAGRTCLEFNFLSDLPTTLSWTGYGFNLVSGACAGSACAYTMTLYKSVAGVKTTLGTGSFSLGTSNTFVGYSTMSVTLTPGGYFTTWIGTTPVCRGYDSSATSRKSNLASINLPITDAGSDIDYNLSDLVVLKGYGSGTIHSRVIDTGIVAPLAGVMASSYSLTGVTGQTEIDFYLRYSTSPNDDMWSSWQASSNNVLAAMPARYWQYDARFYTQVASMTARLGYIELDAVTTGYYYSKVNFIGNLITAWRQFSVTENTPGTYGYAIRSATYSFTASNTSIAWTTQTINQNITVSTGSYAQFRLDSTPLTTNPLGATAAEPITAVFLRWDQGANLPVASATLDRRYFLCVAISSAASAPDVCLVQQKTGKWVTWTTSSTIGAMGLYNNQMIAADGGGSSRVWLIMQPNVYEDDGSPISASWVTGDFTDGFPFNNKTYYGMLIDALPVQGSSVTVAYAINKSTGYRSTEFTVDNGQPLDGTKPVLGSELGSLTKWAPPASGYDTGRYLRLQFSDDQLDDYFRINSYIMFVKDNPWNTNIPGAP